MSVIGELYRVKEEEFRERLSELSSPNIVYVTDLVACSHKRLMRLHYPFMSFRFEPAMIMGELVHRGLAATLAGNGAWRFEVEVEKKFEVDGLQYTVKGRVDLVHYDGDGVPDFIVEVKTAREVHDDTPREHHLLQLRIYMELMNVDRGVLLYITPDRLAEYNISRDSGVNVLELLRETVKDTARPRYEWECRYCPYKKICPYAAIAKRQR